MHIKLSIPGLALALTAGACGATEAAPPGDAPPKLAAARAEPDFAARQHDNAMLIRRASTVLEQDFTPDRYRLMDQALADNAALTAAAAAAGRGDIARVLRQDRVLALRTRGAMQDAWSAYAALESTGVPLPPYVRLAAADAALALRRPEVARVLYADILQAEPGHEAARTGLRYALLESEDLATLQQDLAPALAREHDPARRRSLALFLRFTDRLREADAVLQDLARALPTDAGIRRDRADLELQRGHPRAAEQLYREVLADAPLDIAARVGLAHALHGQRDTAAAAALADALLREAPEHPAVQRLARDAARWQAARWSSGFTRGWGQGQIAGNADLVFETTLTGPASGTGLRWFASHHRAQARFDGLDAHHERLSVGLDLRRRDLQASAEFGHDLRNARTPAWAGAAAWDVDDHWTLRARHENRTSDLPLKGRRPQTDPALPPWLQARKTTLAAAYRDGDARHFAVEPSAYTFNDGNRRRSWTLHWRERLYSGDGRTLDLQPALYRSRNTRADTVYFNPQRDLALSATVVGDWKSWRRYERSFNQRLALTLGRYRQVALPAANAADAGRDYGSLGFHDLRYEHEWQAGADLTLRYGVGQRRFPYDGVHETRRYAYLQLEGRF